MHSDRSYIENLRQTSVGLALQAAEARRRQIYGLEQAFTQAAESAIACAVRGVGPDTGRHILRRLNIPETKRVRDLTARQKDRLAMLLEVIGR